MRFSSIFFFFFALMALSQASCPPSLNSETVDSKLAVAFPRLAVHHLTHIRLSSASEAIVLSTE